VLNKYYKSVKSGFLGSTLILIGGNGLAQVIAIAILPVLTRLYEPSDFSVLAVYSAIVSIFAAAACFRYEVAIPLPKTDSAAMHILFLSVFCAVITFILLCIVVFGFTPLLLKYINLPPLALYLIPFGVFLSSLYSALQYWHVRKKDFPLIAKTRLYQALGGGGIQVLAGQNAFQYGLIFGHIIYSCAGILSMLKRIVSVDAHLFSKLKKKSIKFLAFKYNYYPKFSTLDVLANMSGIHLPIVIMAAFIDQEVAFVMLAMKLMQAPMGLIGGAISQVYYSEAAQKLRHNSLHSFTNKCLLNLVKMGVGPIVLVGAMAPLLTPIFLGYEWSRTGYIIAWMTPWFVLQFISSPISMIMHVKEQQRKMLLLTLFGLFLRIVPLYIVAFNDLGNMVEVYSICSAFFYLTCLFVFSFYSEQSVFDWLSILYQARYSLLSWFFATLLIFYCFRYFL
jgi:O-antigen/teichoic acid export membrane protein